MHVYIKQMFKYSLLASFFDKIIINAELFTRAEAAHVWQEDDAAELLDYVISRNAFIKINENGYYRYHHMLLYVTRERFKALPERERVSVLKRMGEWYLKQVEYMLAGKYFFRAGDWDGLLEAVRRDRGKSINGEHQEEFVKWSSECPPEMLAQDLDAVLVMMRKLFSFQQIPEMLCLRGILTESLSQDSSMSEAERNNYLGECELVMSLLKYNDISAMSELHRRACSLMNRVSRSICSVDTLRGCGAPGNEPVHTDAPHSKAAGAVS